MKRLLLFSFLLFTIVAFSGQVCAITITPATLDQWIGSDNSNLNATQIATQVGYTGGDLTELYKQDVGGPESGFWAPYYTTVFSNTPTDPQDATITWGGGSYISGSPLYLYVKDGNQDPAYYIFDLNSIRVDLDGDGDLEIWSWDGMETIELKSFWPNQGAISHVTILGTNTAPVPEPATMFLFGIGLLGLAGVSRRKNSKR